MVDESVTDTLKALGLLLKTDRESRTLELLKLVLGRQREHGGTLSAHEIRDELRREEPGLELSMASIQKTLRAAVEAGFVRATGHGPQRIRYSSDVSAVERGLQKIADVAKRRILQETHLIDTQLNAVASLDCVALAQDIVSEYTGGRQRTSARLVVGVEDIRRAVAYNIRDMASKGSTIRVSAMSPAPFMGQSGRLVPEIAQAVLRGTNVRCLISSKIPSSAFQIDEPGDTCGSVLDSTGNPRMVIRIYNGPMTYHHVTLNNDCMALIVSEKPMTAAWITRQFNPDIIDASVQDFDESWKDAGPFQRPTPKGGRVAHDCS